MTICIATIANGCIFGAADRMKTAGDVQYEPASAKIFKLTSSMTAMTSGDSAFQAEILKRTYEKVAAKINANPSEWAKVEDVAYLYAKTRNEIRAKRAENSILLPLGLTQDSFLSRQNEMSDDFIASVSKELLNFDVPDVSTIISGIDSAGPHIFMVQDDNVSCRDTTCFASIGIGARHASSQLMLAGLTSYTSIPEALFLTYIAKKRSEVSPGVGDETDMFIIGPNPGTYNPLKIDHIFKLETEYRNLSTGENIVFEKAKVEITNYVIEIIKNAVQEQQEPTQSE